MGILFYRQVWNFLGPVKDGISNFFVPDNYEFAFEICMPAKMAESLQGLDNCFIRYSLRAQIHTSEGETFDISRNLNVRRIYDSLEFIEPNVSFLVLLGDV